MELILRNTFGLSGSVTFQTELTHRLVGLRQPNCWFVLTVDYELELTADDGGVAIPGDAHEFPGIAPPHLVQDQVLALARNHCKPINQSICLSNNLSVND